MTRIIGAEPPAFGPALQGVTYWMGHRSCMYRHYPLSEGAIVAEVCNLLYANLDAGFHLECEVQYTDLLAAVAPTVDVLTEKARADLVVYKEIDGSDELVPKYVIEVKRGNATTAQVNADLLRLGAVCESNKKVRGFLFLVSEGSRPNRFVTPEGASLKGKHAIPKSLYHYRVRRTFKAARYFKSVDKAQYACLIEVFSEDSIFRQKLTGRS